MGLKPKLKLWFAQRLTSISSFSPSGVLSMGLKLGVRCGFDAFSLKSISRIRHLNAFCLEIDIDFKFS